MHTQEGVCTHTTLIILTRGPFYGSRQKLGSELTVEKNRINGPQPRTHQPSLMTTEREPCFERVYLVRDISEVTAWISLLFWRPVSRGLARRYRTPEEYSTPVKGAETSRES